MADQPRKKRTPKPKVYVKKFKKIDAKGRSRYEFAHLSEAAASRRRMKGWQTATQAEFDAEMELRKSEPPPRRRHFGAQSS